LTGKTIAQSEQAISISPARVARDSGCRAIKVTQKNALLVPTRRFKNFPPKRCGLISITVIGRDSFKLKKRGEAPDRRLFSGRLPRGYPV